MLGDVGRFKLQDRPGVPVSQKNQAQGELCLGIEFINYAQARQLEVIKGQGGDAGSVAKYSDYSLTLKVHGSRGMLSKLKSGMRKGLYVESRYALSTLFWYCVNTLHYALPLSVLILDMNSILLATRS